MKRVFVDANVFLRFFTQDDQGQHARSVRLFEQAVEGGVSLVTGPLVLFEIAWTLRSAYGLKRDQVLDVLSRLLGMPGLELVDGKLVERAIALARTSRREFADAYVVESARALGIDRIATFNGKDFSRLGVLLYAL